MINEPKDLDRNTFTPLYFQLKEIIKEQIESGKLKEGELIPSERELAEKYKLSRPTIRQAIKDLVYEGLLYREKGKGTFVAKPKLNYGFIQKFTTFFDDMETKGYLLKTKILKKEVITAPSNISKILDLKEDNRVIYIDRLRFIEDEPVVRVTNFFPYNLCPNIMDEDLNDISFYRLLSQKYEIIPHYADITLEAVVADKLDSKLLNIHEGAPMFFMRNVTYTKNNTVMDYFQSRFRGDKGEVRVKVYR